MYTKTQVKQRVSVKCNSCDYSKHFFCYKNNHGLLAPIIGFCCYEKEHKKIGYGRYGAGLNIKTSPRWCPKKSKL
jgi:hypothetical protein